MIRASSRRLRRNEWFTPGASIYLLVVAVTATVGFSTDSTETILLAALLGLQPGRVTRP
jgi:hypothetical protein